MAYFVNDVKCYTLKELMISLFPSFKDLELSDKEDIQKITSNFPPYSDFNFVSLWVWNTEEKIQISSLHNNLVVKFQDYITNEYFYSFIGTNNAIETINSLIQLSNKNGLKEILKLLPEDNFNEKDKSEIKKKYNIVEDRDNFDYILDIETIASFDGPKLHQKKKMLNHFLNKYPYEVDSHQLTKADENKVMDFFYVWEKLRNKKRSDTINEINAMKRIFIDPEALGLTIMYITSENNLVGYTIFEEQDQSYTVSDFQKADLNFDGAFEALTNMAAKYLLEKKCKYFNIEQDLGIEGLRRAKLDYDPTFLKKYIITKK